MAHPSLTLERDHEATPRSVEVHQHLVEGDIGVHDRYMGSLLRGTMGSNPRPYAEAGFPNTFTPIVLGARQLLVREMPPKCQGLRIARPSRTAARTRLSARARSESGTGSVERVERFHQLRPIGARIVEVELALLDVGCLQVEQHDACLCVVETGFENRTRTSCRRRHWVLRCRSFAFSAVS
jgi:hypothetical protein